MALPATEISADCSRCSEHMLNLFGTNWGIFGQSGMFLAGHTYDVGVMVIFLFQMVFMDTALTIVTGAARNAGSSSTFAVSSVLMGAFTYPLFANWAWGGGWLAQLGTNLGLGKGYCDFAGSGVVHAVGGITALGCGHDRRTAHRQVQPRWFFQRHHRSRHFRRADRLLHPGLRMVRLQPRQHSGRFRRWLFAHRFDRRQHHAGRLHGTFGALLYMWVLKGKPDASMSVNGMLAGLVAITAPSGFVNPTGAAIIGFVAGVLVCFSVRLC